jgi:hypothetical protein
VRHSGNHVAVHCRTDPNNSKQSLFFVILVIIEATGIVTKELKKYLETIGKHSVDSLQKTAILGTSHVIRKVLHQKLEAWVVGFTIGSKGKVPGKTCKKRRRNNKNNTEENPSISFSKILRNYIGTKAQCVTTVIRAATSRLRICRSVVLSSVPYSERLKNVKCVLPCTIGWAQVSVLFSIKSHASEKVFQNK